MDSLPTILELSYPWYPKNLTLFRLPHIFKTPFIVLVVVVFSTKVWTSTSPSSTFVHFNKITSSVSKTKPKILMLTQLTRVFRQLFVSWELSFCFSSHLKVLLTMEPWLNLYVTISLLSGPPSQLEGLSFGTINYSWWVVLSLFYE